MASPIRPMALRSAWDPSFVAMTTSLRARIAPLATGIAALVVATSAAVVVGAGYTSQIHAVRTVDLDTSPAPAPVWVAPCLSEDGSDPTQVFPCVWDGSDPDTGNGVGLTFTITRGDEPGVLCYRYAEPKAQAKYGECAHVL